MATSALNLNKIWSHKYGKNILILNFKKILYKQNEIRMQRI